MTGYNAQQELADEKGIQAMSEVLHKDHYAAAVVKSLKLSDDVLLARHIIEEGKLIHGCEVHRYQVIKGKDSDAGSVIHVAKCDLTQCVIQPQNGEQPIVFVRAEDVLAEEVVVEEKKVPHAKAG